MLKAQKKISKRELKHDALIDWMGKMTSLYEGNRKNIMVVGGAIALLVIGIYSWKQYSTNRNDKAAAQHAMIQQYFDNAQYQIAIDGIPERKVAGLKAIVEEFGGTTAGNLARFYLANSYFQIGKYDEALSHFEEFSAKEQYLEVSRLTGIAGCYEAKGEYEKAAENFEKASTKYPKDIDAAANLNNAAHNFMLAGKNDRAIDLFKKLKSEYPTSQFAREADRFLQRLTTT